MSSEIEKNSKLLHRVIWVLLSFSIMLLTNFSTPVMAANLADFNAGNIIDDAVFTNNHTMSVADIQNFLNSKVPSCDTNGQKISELGGSDINRDGRVQRWEYGQQHLGQTQFVCLRDFKAPDGRSSAQVIYDASASFTINPQVLLVLLQKEMTLVTDDWPSNHQYSRATGYGCPDNNGGVCDSAYYGFVNQVTWAARMYRAILNQSSTWYTPYRLGNNSIYWSPNTSCGQSTVYLQNLATVALYSYTPYRPNQAALNAGYGTGDNCSAYGNRNFFLYFTDWFGSTRFNFGNKPSSTTANSRSRCNIYYFSSPTVMRLYHPDISNYLYTSDYTEACRLVSYGYIWDGQAFTSATESDKIPVYRLGSPRKHIYTTVVAERDNALSLGYTNEGVAFYIYPSSSPSRIPLYKLDKSGVSSVLTSAGKEVDQLTGLGYVTAGVVGYVSALDTTDSTIYRLVRNNERLYSPHQNEIENAMRYGYKPEGSVGTNDIYPNGGNLPIYRIRTPGGVFLYTSSRTERDIAVTIYECTAEGTPFYGLLWSNTPVYRASNPTNGFRVYTPSIAEYNDAVNWGYTKEGPAWFSY